MKRNFTWYIDFKNETGQISHDRPVLTSEFKGGMFRVKDADPALTKSFKQSAERATTQYIPYSEQAVMVTTVYFTQIIEKFDNVLALFK